MENTSLGSALCLLHGNLHLAKALSAALVKKSRTGTCDASPHFNFNHVVTTRGCGMASIMSFQEGMKQGLKKQLGRLNRVLLCPLE